MKLIGNFSEDQIDHCEPFETLTTVNIDGQDDLNPFEKFVCSITSDSALACNLKYLLNAISDLEMYLYPRNSKYDLETIETLHKSGVLDHLSKVLENMRSTNDKSNSYTLEDACARILRISWLCKSKLNPPTKSCEEFFTKPFEEFLFEIKFVKHHKLVLSSIKSLEVYLFGYDGKNHDVEKIIMASQSGVFRDLLNIIDDQRYVYEIDRDLLEPLEDAFECVFYRIQKYEKRMQNTDHNKANFIDKPVEHLPKLIVGNVIADLDKKTMQTEQEEALDGKEVIIATSKENPKEQLLVIEDDYLASTSGTTMSQKFINDIEVERFIAIDEEPQEINNIALPEEVSQLSKTLAEIEHNLLTTLPNQDPAVRSNTDISECIPPTFSMPLIPDSKLNPPIKSCEELLTKPFEEFLFEIKFVNDPYLILDSIKSLKIYLFGHDGKERDRQKIVMLSKSGVLEEISNAIAYMRSATYFNEIDAAEEAYSEFLGLCLICEEIQQEQEELVARREINLTNEYQEKKEDPLITESAKIDDDPLASTSGTTMSQRFVNDREVERFIAMEREHLDIEPLPINSNTSKLAEMHNMVLGNENTAEIRHDEVLYSAQVNVINAADESQDQLLLTDEIEQDRLATTSPTMTSQEPAMAQGNNDQEPTSDLQNTTNFIHVEEVQSNQEEVVDDSEIITNHQANQGNHLPRIWITTTTAIIEETSKAQEGGQECHVEEDSCDFNEKRQEVHSHLTDIAAHDNKEGYTETSFSQPAKKSNSFLLETGNKAREESAVNSPCWQMLYDEPLGGGNYVLSKAKLQNQQQEAKRLFEDLGSQSFGGATFIIGEPYIKHKFYTLSPAIFQNREEKDLVKLQQIYRSKTQEGIFYHQASNTQSYFIFASEQETDHKRVTYKFVKLIQDSSGQIPTYYPNVWSMLDLKGRADYELNEDERRKILELNTKFLQKRKRFSRA